MEKHIELIDQYLDLIHKNLDKLDNIDLNDDKKQPKILVEKDIKVPLDMKILQQRIDSVATIKYYKDLKNERLYDDNVKTEDNVEALYLAVQASNDMKPWPRLDKYSKKQKIRKFIDDLETMGLIENRSDVVNELNELLENKKITKKMIEFDNENNIIRLSKYNLIIE